MGPIIKIENLSKQYRLGTIGTGTLSNDMKRWWYNVRGKEDPFLKIGESNDRSQKGNSEYIWALRDINLEVMPGEVLGIIGKNGAGKSTLLKILSKVTGPTTGSISFNGRIGSLLEVGTGFHPELTGRENIFLNGAILGMTKQEIRSKLDEIVDFSGCERYIDTPVKRYSSGMTVRLGFAVAAHLEPEILVVDEVLAVGDAEFQKKAIGKMQDVSKNDGRTVLFVSHNMAAVENICPKCAIIKNGYLDFIGETNEALNRYLSNKGETHIPLDKRTDRSGSGKIRFQNIKLEKDNLKIGDGLKIDIGIKNLSNEFFDNITVGLAISNEMGTRIAQLSSKIIQYNIVIKSGEEKKLIYEISNLPLIEGNYSLMGIVQSTKMIEDQIENLSSFNIINSDYYNTGRTTKRNFGLINLDFRIYENH